MGNQNSSAGGGGARRVDTHSLDPARLQAEGEEQEVGAQGRGTEGGEQGVVTVREGGGGGGGTGEEDVERRGPLRNLQNIDTFLPVYAKSVDPDWFYSSTQPPPGMDGLCLDEFSPSLYALQLMIKREGKKAADNQAGLGRLIQEADGVAFSRLGEAMRRREEIQRVLPVLEEIQTMGTLLEAIHSRAGGVMDNLRVIAASLDRMEKQLEEEKEEEKAVTDRCEAEGGRGDIKC
eukprot:Nk52_evm11s2367 gene=Nk52_evmTU11s2367